LPGKNWSLDKDHDHSPLKTTPMAWLRQDRTKVDIISQAGFWPLDRCASKEVTMGEARPGESPKRSQAVPFVAEEICRGRQRSRFSMSLICKRIGIRRSPRSGLLPLKLPKGEPATILKSGNNGMQEAPQRKILSKDPLAEHAALLSAPIAGH
jgi:hypothetical protein